jgi:hypothetical protein
VTIVIKSLLARDHPDKLVWAVPIVNKRSVSSDYPDKLEVGGDYPDKDKSGREHADKKS